MSQRETEDDGVPEPTEGGLRARCDLNHLRPQCAVTNR